MREYTLYIWIGIWLLILPFLGLPGSWKQALNVLTGLFIIGDILLRYRKNRTIQDALDETKPNAEEKSGNLPAEFK